MKIINQSTVNFKFIVPSFFLLLSAFMLGAQDLTPIQEKLQAHKAFFSNAEVIRPMSVANVDLNQRSVVDKAVDIEKAIFLTPDFKKLSGVIAKNSDKMAMAIPLNSSSDLELYLIKAKVFSDEFKVYVASDRSKPFPYTRGVHYWGTVKDHPNSLVAVSFYKDNIAGVINYNGKFYDLGKLENGINGQHILYENKDLKEQFELDCSTVEPEGNANNGLSSRSTSSASEALDNCVKMYLETDYSMYEHYGSVVDVTNYVTGAFSQVILLYANESINMVINELVVWDVVDPYPGTNTADILNQFRTVLNGNYNGDLGHLIIKNTEVSGGRAYLNVICSSTYGVGVSGIRTYYNNVPTYSWTVSVLAHEIGHNLGSRHTHDCVWNGDNTPIDGCGPSAGYPSTSCDGATVYPPLPSEGGTIMSYCHLTGVGIDLGLGFGPQPGDLIRNNVANSTCLSSCGPLAVNIISSANVSCGGSNDGSATASASGGSGSYTYSWSNGANGTTVSNLAAGTYTVIVDDGTNTANDSVTIVDNNSTYYADSDGDGYGDPSVTTLACTQPTNYVSDNSDCDDTNNIVYPGAPEICDGLDNDCLNGIDDGWAVNTYYADSDGDGYGDANVTTSACAAPADYVSDDTDCDDTNANVNPGADEICDNLDNDCNLSVDEGFPTNTYYADTDGDGYGDPLNTTEACTAPTGYASNNSDCDDSDSAIYPGGTCDDGDDCTINDVYDNCNCAGTYADSDGDGVCDADDICPGGDDNIDTDNNGIPDFCDCNFASTNFSGNSLSHSGTGFSVISVPFDAENRDPSFTISEISQRVNGKPANRFVEFVTVSYVDGNGDTQPVGTYSGANTNSAVINISGFVQSITVQLEDIYDGSTNATMNIALSNVSYCAKWTDPDCPDADGDGVCDADDICPGGDDNIDTDGDGTPDACECQNSESSQFDPIPGTLTHSGTGFSTSTVNIPPGNTDVSFSISNIDQKINGKKTTRYIERVEVSYIDGSNTNQIHDTYSGTGTTNVNIAGEVHSVTLKLDDAYSGSNGSIPLSVSMSDVTSCINSGAAPSASESPATNTLQRITLYPNPAKNKVFVRFDASVSELKITLYDVLGKQLKTYNFLDEQRMELDVDHLTKGNIYFVRIEISGRTPEIRKLILAD